MLFANAAAILTDAFPAEHRGMALGLNQVAGIAGQFVGLILGGLLGPVEWHLVFLVSVPFGVFGTFWAYRSLRELGERRPVHFDWWGNLAFGAGLTALLAGITYGIQPYGGHAMGWTNPWVITGIAMLPLTIGFLAAGPVSGALSDRFGARAFTTGGMLITAASFLLLDLLPVNFAYWQFALILLLAGVGQGLFGAPNRAAIMNSLPPERRGAGSGMTATFQNSATVLSIGIFFTLIILGVAATLPTALSHGLTAQGVPPASAARVAGLPPVSILFAALLGYNPVSTLLGPALAHLPAARAAYLTGRSFFPSVISPAFGHGLAAAFDFAIAACLIAAAVSLLRGRTYAYGNPPASAIPTRRKPPAAARNVLTAACRARFCRVGAPPHPGMGNPTHSPAYA